MEYNFEFAHRRVGWEASKWDMLPKDIPDYVVPLSVADMELLSPPEVIEALVETAKLGMWGYTEGGDRYFEACSSWMKERHSWEIEKDWIVQLNGVVQGIYAAVRAFTKSGDGVLIQTPVYPPFYRSVNENGRRVLESPLRLTNGKYEIDFDDFEEKAKEAKMCILCNPHNPVGRVWTKEELERIGDICIKNNVFVVSDEIHFDLIMPGHKHTVFASIKDDFAQNCLILNSASKTFSLAGLCVANAYIPNKKYRELFCKEVNLSGCFTLSIFGFRAVEAAYMYCASWVDKLNNHVYTNYKYLKEFLNERYPQIFVADLEGTYLAWLDCSAFGLSGAGLSEHFKKEGHLYFDDGAKFGSAGEAFERVNLACPFEVLRSAVDRFDKALSLIK